MSSESLRTQRHFYTAVSTVRYCRGQISLSFFTTDVITAVLKDCVQAVVGNCQDLTLPVDQNCVASKPATRDLFSSDGVVTNLILGGELVNEPSELGTGKALNGISESSVMYKDKVSHCIGVSSSFPHR